MEGAKVAATKTKRKSGAKANTKAKPKAVKGKRGTKPQPWADDIYDMLKAAGVTQFTYVPDAGHRTLIDRALADPDVAAVPLTTEEEGVALCAGADLGHGRAVLMMQSSGVGNCVNFFSLMKGAHFPLLMIVSMRGDYGEQNPWQMAMGQAVDDVLAAMDFVVLKVDREADVRGAVEAGIGMSYKGGKAVAVLLTQKFLGAKAF